MYMYIFRTVKAIILIHFIFHNFSMVKYILISFVPNIRCPMGFESKLVYPLAIDLSCPLIFTLPVMKI